jgi:hypothetical protein
MKMINDNNVINNYIKIFLSKYFIYFTFYFVIKNSKKEIYK